MCAWERKRGDLEMWPRLSSLSPDLTRIFRMTEETLSVRLISPLPSFCSSVGACACGVWNFWFLFLLFFWLVVHPDLLMKTRFVILNCPVLPSIPANRWHCRCVRAPSRPIPLQLQLVWTRSIPIFGRYFGYHRNDYGFAFLWFPSQQQTNRRKSSRHYIIIEREK